jgi:aspartate kinase
MLVVKLGGTTVRYGRKDIINKISALTYDTRLIIVVSALAGVTDLLAVGDIEQVRRIHHSMTSNPYTLSIIDNYLNEYSTPTNPITRARALSIGELMSMYLFSEFLGVDHICIPSTEFIRTDNNYGNAIIDWQQTEALIHERLVKGGDGCRIIITTGFIGKYKDEITTLGRGGSDYTASIIGSLVGADRIIIYSDVDGLMTSDPKTDPNAILIKRITYRDALDMSRKGAKVLYHRTLEPLLGVHIPLYILNTFSESVGTVVYAE